jgi:hypothetical protein
LEKMVSLFERLNKERPLPAEERIKPDANARDLQRLHDWLQNDWNKPTIRARDICRFGPNAIRDRKRAVDLAKILVSQGRLTPIPTRRRDMKAWQIVRRPGGEG